MEDRTLDIAVARVMGWTGEPEEVGFSGNGGTDVGWELFMFRNSPSKPNVHEGSVNGKQMLPRFSTDRNAAWDIVDWMLQFHCDFTLECAGDENWYCTFPLASGRGKTAAEAICRAAVEAGKETKTV